MGTCSLNITVPEAALTTWFRWNLLHRCRLHPGHDEVHHWVALMLKHVTCSAPPTWRFARIMYPDGQVSVLCSSFNRLEAPDPEH